MMTGAGMKKKINGRTQSEAKETSVISTVTSKNGKVTRLTDKRWTGKLKGTARMQDRPGGAKIIWEHWGTIPDKREMVLYVGGRHGKGYFRAT